MTLALQIGIVVAALAASTAGGAWAVGRMLDVVGVRTGDAGLRRGGMWIGVLERLAVTAAILAGFPEAIAVVIAVKGLGRYPELRAGDGDDHSVTAETFIIGTLASYVWAALWALLALWGIAAVA